MTQPRLGSRKRSPPGRALDSPAGPPPLRGAPSGPSCLGAGPVASKEKRVGGLRPGLGGGSFLGSGSSFLRAGVRRPAMSASRKVASWSFRLLS
ncbi:MAG: hypothetical protein LBO05_14060 [Deltaproteobacteria bacterium]|nr:hypothetical protein [Deltaproteobacteria bacterium]